MTPIKNRLLSIVENWDSKTVLLRTYALLLHSIRQLDRDQSIALISALLTGLNIYSDESETVIRVDNFYKIYQFCLEWLDSGQPIIELEPIIMELESIIKNSNS
jgi:hypothetical protein